MKTYTIGQGFNGKSYAMLIYLGMQKMHDKPQIKPTSDPNVVPGMLQ